ncbi:TPA: Protein arginine N-methyltransferase 7 [Trebouxia sp. C0004]
MYSLSTSLLDGMFAQRFNALSGRVDWVHVPEEKASQTPVPGLSDSLYLDMLTDTKRNHAYAACLKEVVRPGQDVLDIGTGTGLLAMLAAKCVNKPCPGEGHVTACEVYPPMVNLARQLVSHNRLTGSIDVYQKRSDELTVLQGRSKQSDSSALSAQASTTIGQQQAPEQQCEQSQQDCTATPAMRKSHSRLHTPGVETPDRPDMPHKPDVIVTEIFDSELLGEGILTTMRHAVKHLLQVVLSSQPQLWCMVS